MVRVRKGTLEPAGTWPSGSPRFRFRLRLGDGSKSRRFDVPEELDEKQARAFIASMQAQEDARGQLLEKKRAEKREKATVDPVVAGDLMDRWFNAWEKSRKTRGLSATADNRSHFYGHIIQDFGGKHIQSWTTDDVRRHVRALDEKVEARTISWKYAVNIWGTTRKMCADAVSSKLDVLRVRTDDPTTNVEGPYRGAPRAKPFLYPSEFLQFVTCETVPMRWRFAVTLAIYLFPRHGELRVLTWDDGDVDLDHGQVHIHRAWDRRAKIVKTTKTGGTRRFNIEPALLRVLRELRDAGAHGPLVSLVSEPEMAVGLRRWLAHAGVRRRELHETTETTKKLAWHDLRATGLTWMAVRGDEPLKIMQRAGHTNFGTTQIYVRTAEAIREGFGEVFPQLPAGLFGPELWSSVAARFRKRGGRIVGQPGLEPETNGLRVHCSTN